MDSAQPESNVEGGEVSYFIDDVAALHLTDRERLFKEITEKLEARKSDGSSH